MSILANENLRMQSNRTTRDSLWRARCRQLLQVGHLWNWLYSRYVGDVKCFWKLSLPAHSQKTSGSKAWFFWFRSNDSEEACHLKVRNLAVIPICSFRRTHSTLDNYTLYKLVCGIGRAPQIKGEETRNTTFSEFMSDKDWSWKKKIWYVKNKLSSASKKRISFPDTVRWHSSFITIWCRQTRSNPNRQNRD